MPGRVVGAVGCGGEVGVKAGYRPFSGWPRYGKLVAGDPTRVARVICGRWADRVEPAPHVQDVWSQPARCYFQNIHLNEYTEVGSL